MEAPFWFCFGLWFYIATIGAEYAGLFAMLGPPPPCDSSTFYDFIYFNETPDSLMLQSFLKKMAILLSDAARNSKYACYMRLCLINLKG